MFNLTLSEAAKDLLINIINIVVLFIIVKFLVYKPVKKFLDARSERISAQKTELETKIAQANATLGERSAIIESAKDEAEKAANEILLSAQESAAKVNEDAENTAKKIIAEAEEEAKDQREKTVIEAKDEIAGMAVEISSRILSREVTESDREKMVDEFLNSLGEEQ